MDNSVLQPSMPQVNTLNNTQNPQAVNSVQTDSQNTNQDLSEPAASKPTTHPDNTAAQPFATPPISGPSKEGSPLISTPLIQESSPVQLSEKEPVLSPEVKDSGVSINANPEIIDIKPELKAAGVNAEKTAVPVQTAPSNNIQLPMTEEEARKTVKTHPAVDAAFGLGVEVLKQLQRIHKGIFKNQK